VFPGLGMAPMRPTNQEILTERKGSVQWTSSLR